MCAAAAVSNVAVSYSDSTKTLRIQCVSHYSSGQSEQKCLNARSGERQGRYEHMFLDEL